MGTRGRPFTFKVAGPPPPSMIKEQHIETASDGVILFGGQMISEGQDRTVNGCTTSNGQGRIVIGGTTFEKPSYRTPVPTTVPAPLPTAIDGKPLEFGGNDALVFDGESVLSGQQTTIDSKRVFMGAREVVIDSKTYSLPTLPQPTPADSTGWSTQINGEEVVFDHDGKIVLDGFTMSPGEQTTVEGIYVSAGQSSVVMSGYTYTAPSSSALSSSDPGITQFSIADSPGASPSTSASAVPGKPAAEADKCPTTSNSGQKAPGEDSGLGAVITSAFGNMSSSPTVQASPAATPALTTSSGATTGQSNGSAYTATRSLWIALAAAVCIML
ncbi:MAG: hypothetical protein L6R39_004546 [Caloplaca ligustica]|nr:MAG: hypothetical protein L6R39_004546 [Caloplaca ligustica]